MQPSAARPGADRRRVRYRPLGPALYWFWHALLGLLILMELVALIGALTGGKVEESFVWGMPLFIGAFALWLRWVARPVVVEVDDARRVLRILRPFVWPIPPSVRTVPLDEIVAVWVRGRSGGPDGPDYGRLELQCRGNPRDVPLSSWAHSSDGRLERVAAAIEGLVKLAR